MVEEALRYLGAGDAPEDLRRQVLLLCSKFFVINTKNLFDKGRPLCI